MKPMVSIIIPVFNRENLVQKTLDSLLTQTYSNWECIIVDDGSTDNTYQVLLDYYNKDSRIKPYRNIDLLIMDEATSALDTETENYIKQNIEDLHGKYMMVIIAHKLSTIKHADVIYLMKNGEIINSGSFSELYEMSDQF